jgi:hypothetical protein
VTDPAHGVLFRFYGTQKQQVSWTDPQYGNAWLALDRNGNGTIDDASELFGNDTPQPQSKTPNGFAALAVYDLPENGGNGDGVHYGCRQHLCPFAVVDGYKPPRNIGAERAAVPC